MNNENINIFISYEIYNFNIAVKHIKFRSHIFSVIQVKIPDYQFEVEFVQLILTMYVSPFSIFVDPR